MGFVQRPLCTLFLVIAALIWFSGQNLILSLFGHYQPVLLQVGSQNFCPTVFWQQQQTNDGIYPHVYSMYISSSIITFYWSLPFDQSSRKWKSWRLQFKAWIAEFIKRTDDYHHRFLGLSFSIVFTWLGFGGCIITGHSWELYVGVVKGAMPAYRGPLNSISTPLRKGCYCLCSAYSP